MRKVDRDPNEWKHMLDLNLAGWAQFQAENGAVLPEDQILLGALFYKMVLQAPDVPIPVKLMAREKIRNLGCIYDDPVTVHERLSASPSAQQRPGFALTRMLQFHSEIVLLFPNEQVRSFMFMRHCQILNRDMDKVRTSVRTWDLYLLDGRHVKYLTEEDDYDIPAGNVGYRYWSSLV